MMLQIGAMKASKAFTLIEILLVIIIIGVVLAIAVPNFSKSVGRFQLNETVDDILNLTRWAQAMAIGQGRVYALDFTQDHLSYNLIRSVSADAPDLELVFEPLKGRLGKLRPVPMGLKLKTSKDQIKFYPDGTIDEAVIDVDSGNEKMRLSSEEVRGMMIKVDSE